MRRNLPEQKDARSGILYMSMSMTIAVCCVAARRVHAQIDFGLDRQMTSGTKHFCKCSDATRWGSACGWRIQQKRQNRCRERERIWTTTPNAHVSALYCRWIFLKNIFFSFFLFSFFRCSDNLLLLLLRSHMCDAIPFNIFSFVLFHFGCLILAGNINIFFFRSLPCSFILHFILWIFFFLFGQAAVVVFRVVE